MERFVSDVILSALHNADGPVNQLQPPSSPLLSRSLSAPSKLDRSLSVQEGVHDVRRLQRWRTNVQKRHSRSSPEDQPDSGGNKTFVSTVTEIFSFIGGDPDEAVSNQTREKALTNLLKYKYYFPSLEYLREQGWRSGESARLPPMWLGFDSWSRFRMWVEFVVGSRPFSERFFSG